MTSDYNTHDRDAADRTRADRAATGRRAFARRCACSPWGCALIAVGWSALTVAGLLARVTEHRSGELRRRRCARSRRGVRVRADRRNLGRDVRVHDTVLLVVDGQADRSATGSTATSCRSRRRARSPSGIGCTGRIRLVVPSDVEVRVHASDGSLTLRDLDGPSTWTRSDGSVTRVGPHRPDLTAHQRRLGRCDRTCAPTRSTR